MYSPFLPRPEKFDDPEKAFQRISDIYEGCTTFIREAFSRFSQGEDLQNRVRGYYPYIRLNTDTASREDRRRSYGFVSSPGLYQTTLTRPDLYEEYYKEQIRLLLKNHAEPIEVGVSDMPIPVHFAFNDGLHVEGGLTQERAALMNDFFDRPNLEYVDDDIANSGHVLSDRSEKPLALFTAPRVDYSLHRLRHYTATAPRHFQGFVLFTNYQFYIDEFVKLGTEIMTTTDDPELKEYRSQYTSFVQPGDYEIFNENLEDRASEGTPLARLPQMPAYHLKRADGTGITMVNIGVGPSNAKTITDHIAVLRPHAWLMLGHCAGLRSTQRLGDYVLAHGYVREDHVLDADLPLWVPVPALAEIQQSLQAAVAEVTGFHGGELKSVMRTGTVATIDNRNWELRDHLEPIQRFSQSRAIALDMESATIAANGFRFRVPYGTLLCVSDKPLHGELKLPGMANSFYRDRVDQHLNIGIKAVELLREDRIEKLHSRKLRSFDETAFR